MSDVVADDRRDSPDDSPDDGPDDVRDVSTEALVSRVQIIDDRPLDQRAQAYVQVYDELRTRLEGSDTPRHSA